MRARPIRVTITAMDTAFTQKAPHLGSTNALEALGVAAVLTKL
jgi:hypothetical protein